MNSQMRGTSKNSALRSKMSSKPRGISNILTSKNESVYSKSPKNIPLMATKKGGQRFMTKKEKDAMELQVKRSKAFKEKQKRMKELAKEIEEMKEMVNEKVKDLAIIRRNSIQAFSDLAII